MTDKMGKDGLSPIFVRSKHNGNEFKYFTGEKYKIEEWDMDFQKIKRINKNYKNINLWSVFSIVSVSQDQPRDGKFKNYFREQYSVILAIMSQYPLLQLLKTLTSTKH